MNITSVDQLLSFCPEMEPPVPAALKYFYKERILDDGFWLNFDAHEGPEAQLLEKLNQAYETGEFKESCADINRCINFIKLINGSNYSRGQFNENILFKISTEKDKVFSSLWLLTHTEGFDADYDAFLMNLRRPDWYAPYRDQEFAKRQAYFALYAYLSGAIHREELLIIHTVGAAYVEVAEAFGKAEELSVRVVGKDELVDVLTNGNFPPYSPMEKENILIRRKSESDTEEIKEQILDEWEGRSFVLRTVIDYPLDENGESSDGETYNFGIRVGFYAGRVILLPPEFTVDLVKRSSACDLSNPKAHWFSFDYSSSTGEPFYLGLRIITTPSLLFPITSRPHNAKRGPPALTMLVHDINYHIFLSGNIPKNQKEITIEIAKSFNFYRSSHSLIKEGQSKEQRKLSQTLAHHLADGEFFFHRTPVLSSVAAFWKGLDFWIAYVKSNCPDTTVEWRDKIVAPVLADVLAKYQDDDIFILDEDVISVNTYLTVNAKFQDMYVPRSCEWPKEEKVLTYIFNNQLKVTICQDGYEERILLDAINVGGESLMADPLFIERSLFPSTYAAVFETLSEEPLFATSDEKQRAVYFHRKFIEFIFQIMPRPFNHLEIIYYENVFNDIGTSINIEKVFLRMPALEKRLAGASSDEIVRVLRLHSY